MFCSEKNIDLTLKKGKGSPILDFKRWVRCLSPVLGHQPLGGIAIVSAVGGEVFPPNQRLSSQLD